MKREDLILGAGVTGLAAARTSGFRALEASASPGGICCSYYQRPGSTQRLDELPEDAEAYRFELGGGHWIFGGDPWVLDFLHTLGPLRTYRRRAAVFLPEARLLVPYPLQYHLSVLGADLACAAMSEMRDGTSRGLVAPACMADWIERIFGRTLKDLFFGPFHELYTAGLWTVVAPQDAHKSPLDLALVMRGAQGESVTAGYNTTFLYPRDGLAALTRAMARGSAISYRRTVAAVDTRKREVLFADGGGASYERLISTLPLNRMLAMTGLEVDAPPDPSTSVLVLNLGAKRGAACPDAHWIYVPRSRSRFFRVGFYSNVDGCFLPSDRDARVSLYAERAYSDGQRPTEQEVERYTRGVIEELTEWGFIQDVEVTSSTWIDVAYTWSMPGSAWRRHALNRLQQQGITMVGRYGRWQFQGIADSIRDGFVVGASLRRESA